MPSSVIITSPKPNNHALAVMSQAVDSEGAPVGEPEGVAILDDGETTIAEVGPNNVVVITEMPRDAARAAMPRPIADAGRDAQPRVEFPRLIGEEPEVAEGAGGPRSMIDGHVPLPSGGEGSG